MRDDKQKEVKRNLNYGNYSHKWLDKKSIVIISAVSIVGVILSLSLIIIIPTFKAVHTSIMITDGNVDSGADASEEPRKNSSTS